jgi:ABC-type multidrug transport system permease subunit
MTSGPVSQQTWSDAPIYALAALAGVGTGCVDVAINDLLFTALLAVMACMALGMLRPRWPWRWVAAVSAFVPLTELGAYLIRAVKPTRAQVYGSLLVALPGIAGAYGGAVVRRAIDALRQGQ